MKVGAKIAEYRRLWQGAAARGWFPAGDGAGYCYTATPQHCTSLATTAANTHHEEAACSVCTKLLMSHSRQKQVSSSELR